MSNERVDAVKLSHMLRFPPPQGIAEIQTNKEQQVKPLSQKLALNISYLCCFTKFIQVDLMVAAICNF